VKKVLIFGCSHSRSFKDVEIDGFDLTIHTHSGASVLGLKKSKSHLEVGKAIREELRAEPPTDFLVLKLGQVDTENIFLYKKHILKSEGLFDIFSDKVMASYDIFIDSLSGIISDKNIVICGINPPSPADREPIIRQYLHTMRNGLPNPKDFGYLTTDEAYLDDLLYENRLLNSRSFNRKLKALCARRGITFFEVFEELLDGAGKIHKQFEGKNFHIKGTNHTEKKDPADPLVKEIFSKALAKALSA